MLYSIERQVEPAYRKSVFECEPGGALLRRCLLLACIPIRHTLLTMRLPPPPSPQRVLLGSTSLCGT